MRARSAWGMGLVLLVACGEARVERSPEPDDAAEAAAPEATIPDASVRGTVRGRAFAYERASLNEGILELRQGEDFFADLEVTLFLSLAEKDVLPEGRSWDVDCAGGWEGGTPHVHVAWRDQTGDVPTHESVTCDYRLRLAFGGESAGRMPGRIALRIPSLDTEIAGTFEAEIEGLVRRGGEVDLTLDDLDVAQHLAALWLAEEAGQEVEVIDRELGWIHTAPPEGRPQAGYSVYWWRSPSGGATQIAKLQFEKSQGTWQVARALELWQVAAAHPISPRRDLMGSFDLRAAQRFEQDLVARRGKKPVFVSEVRSSYNPVAGLAETTLRYALDGEEARKLGFVLSGESPGSVARYLFRTEAAYPEYKEPDAWRLERSLEEGEVVDFKSGTIRTAR